jgi:hypothetical protein
VSKYAQATQSKVGYHTYPSGCQVIKAFTAKDFAFFDKSRCHLNTVNDSSFEVADTIRVTWRIQKIAKMAKQSLLTVPIQTYVLLEVH